MALNYAEQWSPELLEILMQGTLTSPFVTSNVRWLDAKTFHFTQMSTSGYKNHSREGGWNKGTYTQTDVPYTLTHGIAFRPVSIHTQGDPSIEAGDIAVITDRKGNKYKTILTGVIYTAKAQQDLICGAESPAEQSAVRYSKATQVYRELRKTVAKQKTEFEKSLEALKTAMGEKRGLYPITEVLEDGSSILYFCDQDTVAESKIVVKLNASGWGMSTDGGKTWNTGVLVDGTMIAKILNTIGINADWINTGAIEIKTEDGETIFRVDMDSKSVYMSGDVRIGGKKFSESIDNAITDSKNYADSKLADYSKTVADSLEGLQGQIDGQIESFYYEYEPSLQNIPASEWTTTEERKKHEGDLFFWKPNKDTGEGGYAYRFLYDSSVSKWEWVLVQDTDITKALAAAQNAQDTADGKRRTFIVTPYPPYDIGDTWNQEDGDILTCVVARAAGTSYVSTDWRKLNKYTDDTVAEEAKKAAEQAKEAAALAKNMVLTLSNDSQSITVDADGKYNTFPTTVTQATVMYGSTDISVDCEYEITKSTGITGNWNKSNRIYTVTGLSENSGWVEIKATYINRQFDWRRERGGWHQEIGFVADELEKIDPNLAMGGGYDENGEMDIKQINSTYLLSYAVKAIQELSTIVKNQNKHIEELERRLS